MTVLEIKQKLQALSVRFRASDQVHNGTEDFIPYPEYVRGCGREILEWFSKFNDILLKHIKSFEFPERKVVLLTVCSYAKPYSHSFIHYGIRKALCESGLLDRIEYWHLSSAGVIPSCLEEEVPYCCYDWNNEHADDDDLKALRKFLEVHYLHWLKQYASPLRKRVVTYFRVDSNTRKAIDRVLFRPEIAVAHVQVRSWTQRTDQEKRVTLGGGYTDPDCMLLDQVNLSSLIRVLSQQCER